MHIDFHAINRPCTCIAFPFFDGQLLITTREIVHDCDTQIYATNADTTFRYGCPIPFTTQLLIVNINQSVDVRAVYLSSSISGTFYHCLGFQQNSMNLRIDTCIQNNQLSFVMLISNELYFFLLLLYFTLLYFISLQIHNDFLHTIKYLYMMRGCLDASLPDNLFFNLPENGTSKFYKHKTFLDNQFQ